MDRQEMKNFKDLCRKYKDQKRWMEHLKDTFILSDGIEESTVPFFAGRKPYFMGYRILEKNVRYVDEVLRKIEAECGKDAAMMVRDVYIEGVKTDDLAESCSIKKRTLQRYLSKWIAKGLEGEKDDR